MLIPESQIYMEWNITTEEVMEKPEMFQERFGKIDEFFWWYMDRIQTGAGVQFTYKEFQEGLPVCVVWVARKT